ncbi:MULTISPECIES: hypothetical protein [Acinetobacter]|uniref:hypothetical protein n=1 Tax=Acinetobacter TaxID=469 RepID=UPI0007A096D9|nr:MULTISPECIES: hypothetical protein [unclassified Acinetobacter]KYQ85033.1 hypothetical protein AWW72_05935 [Acinetobacter sp. NRRL B-65365]OEC89971.1 hypothetical protein A9Z07_05300 [Acinetobacter sp. YK3]
MLKKTFIFICLYHISTLAMGDIFISTKTHSNQISEQESGIIYYIPFYMRFSTNRPEGNFEDYAFCKGTIKKNQFIKLIHPTTHIYRGDPRAKIIFKDAIFFVDSNGIATNFAQNFQIEDTDILIKDIENINFCNQ